MADRLKPGQFVPRAQGARSFDYAGVVGSMAQTMEDELDALLAMDGRPALKHDADDVEVRDRRRLFVAIARGVVIHLRENQGAFTVPLSGWPVLGIEIETEEG